MTHNKRITVEAVTATLPWLPPTVANVVYLQLTTGNRTRDALANTGLTRTAYLLAVRRGIKRANRAGAAVPSWHPYDLRRLTME